MTACSIGADNLKIAGMLIKSGIVDVVIAGVAESPITKISIVGFDKLYALSSDIEKSLFAHRPFGEYRC
jgi:3-oxoacyl-(acyl-carrier-protein) synthase